MIYSNLSFEASNVAIAIDNHLLKRATPEEYQTVERLSDKLYGISKDDDPTSKIMMAEIIWPNREDWKGKKVEDVELQTWLLAKDLSTFISFSRERQEGLRSICLELSNQARKYVPHSYRGLAA